MEKQALIKLCVDVVKNPAQVQQFSKGKDVDATIRGKFFEIMGTETPTKKDIRANKVAIFEILEEVLTETYLNGINEDEFFMRFAEIRNLALGDSQEFYIEDDGVIIVSEHAGNHWKIDRQKLEGGDTFTVAVKAHAAAIYGDFFLFVTGRLSFGRLVAKVAEGIQNKIAQEVAASFASGAANLPAAFKKSGAYDEDAMLDLVSHVEAVAGSAYVVGTRKALAKVTAGSNVALYSDSMKNELATTGRVANFNGMTLIQLPAVHKANSFDFAYDDDQLLVLPANDDKFIKIVFEGDDLVRETTDNTANVDMSFDYSFIAHWGVKTVFSSLFGQYKFI
jgi:hypothetical protein